MAFSFSKVSKLGKGDNSVSQKSGNEHCAWFELEKTFRALKILNNH